MEEDQGALLCRQADTKQLGDQHAQRTEEVSHSLQQPHHRRGLGRRRRLPHRSEARCQILLVCKKAADRVGWLLQLGTWTRCARAAALPGGRRRMATRPCWAARTELIIHCCSSLARRSRTSQSSYRIAMRRSRAGNCRRHVPALSAALASGGPIFMGKTECKAAVASQARTQ